MQDSDKTSLTLGHCETTENIFIIYQNHMTVFVILLTYYFR